MKLLELAGPLLQTTAGTAAKTVKSSQGVFQNWLMSEAGLNEISEQGKDAPNSGDQLADALKKISDWLKASPEDQDKHKAELLQTLSKLTGKQLDETSQQLLQNLLQAVESKTSSGTDQLLAELDKMTSEGKTALADNDPAADSNGEMNVDTEQSNQDNEVSEDDKELALIQMFISQLLEGNKLTERGNGNEAHVIYQNGEQFLSALEKKGVSQQLIQDLKQQIFTKDESGSKLYSMTASELKSFQSLMEQMSMLPQKGTKEWNLAESQLKAFLLSKSSESSQDFGKRVLTPLSQNSFSKSASDASGSIQPVDSKSGLQMLFSGYRNTGAVQPLDLQQLSSDLPTVETKTAADQVINAWKQMKYTPFGRSTGSFTIRLNPEHLGFVTIKLTNENGMFQSKIIASSQSAKELLEQHLPQLKQSLPNMAVQIDRFTLPVQSGDQPIYGQLADEQRQQQEGQKQQRQKKASNDFGDLLDELSMVEMEEEE
ncbi:flagellar hook-length control protein FliK [Bacillus vallismortis]|uniref:Flagellar hook-length control protein FliK n=1 Tax=Bacillus vallismortis TaxID=72361 RepID=A0ABY4Y3D3_BACVA|nr:MULTISPECIES: flagellar hook-length control protein FliK [Bacillus]MBL3647174.1 flagellar hook-length control protein FliK [Bacillus sp. RHFS10]USP97126.1 flagellar hook-length control protein FliK [Bacillus vallismortis]